MAHLHRDLYLQETNFPYIQLAREVLDIVASNIRPGVTTDELDAICHEECLKRDSYPSPLNYRCFPKSICTSVNEVICHVSCLITLFVLRSRQLTVLVTGYVGYPRSATFR